MKPLTELDLRMALKDSDVKTFTVPQGTVVTPAAMEYLNQRRVELLFDDTINRRQASPLSTSNMEARMRKTDQCGAVEAPGPKEKPIPKWDFSGPKTQAESDSGQKAKDLFYGPDGGAFDHKPESLTHLKGRQLVHKDHPIIIWRGKLDTFCARLIEAQVIGWQLGSQEFVDELQEILDFSRSLLTCEIRGKEVDDFNLLGLDAAALRERSHNPIKFFGHRHMMAEYKMGPLAIALNTLRALVREVELAAANAFKDTSGSPTRDDIIRALNRLSSLFYIMMFSYLPEGFEPEHSGI